jgi:hypothetical protein
MKAPASAGQGRPVPHLRSKSDVEIRPLAAAGGDTHLAAGVVVSFRYAGLSVPFSLAMVSKVG